MVEGIAKRTRCIKNVRYLLRVLYEAELPDNTCSRCGHPSTISPHHFQRLGLTDLTLTNDDRETIELDARRASSSCDPSLGKSKHPCIFTFLHCLLSPRLLPSHIIIELYLACRCSPVCCYLRVLVLHGRSISYTMYIVLLPLTLVVSK